MAGIYAATATFTKLMPELPEIEAYRTLAERALHRTIAEVVAPDAWFLKRGLDAATVTTVLTGASFVAARRIGKLLLMDTDGGPVVGMRFGMTGKLVVDGVAGVYDLMYSSNAELEKWDRFVLHFEDGGHLRMRDPRRLGGVELDPPEERLGVDARTVTAAQLRALLLASTAPLKARLMDQKHLAGVGNLIADETLFRSGLLPSRPARSLTAAEIRRLHKHLLASVEDLIAGGGSHTGDFLPHRTPGGTCPKDGRPLQRGVVGGRTTWWCPKHQV